MKEKFEKIYKENKSMIFKIAFSYVLSSNDAEDIVQKTFYKLYCRNKILELDDSEIKKWLIRVCINESKDFFKLYWNRKKVEIINDLEIKDISDEYNDVILMLSDLKIEYRIPLFLYYYQGYKIYEIAEILKKSESYIKNKLKEGKNILKKEIER